MSHRFTSLHEIERIVLTQCVAYGTCCQSHQTTKHLVTMSGDRNQFEKNCPCNHEDFILVDQLKLRPDRGSSHIACFNCKKHGHAMCDCDALIEIEIYKLHSNICVCVCVLWCIHSASVKYSDSKMTESIERTVGKHSAEPQHIALMTRLEIQFHHKVEFVPQLWLIKKLWFDLRENAWIIPLYNRNHLCPVHAVFHIRLNFNSHFSVFQLCPHRAIIRHVRCAWACGCGHSLLCMVQVTSEMCIRMRMYVESEFEIYVLVKRFVFQPLYDWSAPQRIVVDCWQSCSTHTHVVYNMKDIFSGFYPIENTFQKRCAMYCEPLAHARTHTSMHPKFTHIIFMDFTP